MAFIEQLFAGAAGLLILAGLVWVLVGFPVPRTKEQKAKEVHLVKRQAPTGETRLMRQRADGRIVPRSRNEEIFRFTLWIVAIVLLPVAWVADWQELFDGSDDVLLVLAVGVAVSTGYYVYRMWVERKAPWTHEPSPNGDEHNALPDKDNEDTFAATGALRTAGATLVGGAALVALILGAVWLAVQLSL